MSRKHFRIHVNLVFLSLIGPCNAKEKAINRRLSKIPKFISPMSCGAPNINFMSAWAADSKFHVQ